MSHDGQPPRGSLQLAFDELIGTVQSVEQSLGWRQTFQDDVAALEKAVRQYIVVMQSDRDAIERGFVMHKDQPRTKWDKRKEVHVVVRPRGFVDAAHKAEYQAGRHFTAMLDRLEETPLSVEDRHQLRDALNVLALALHNTGIVLDQRKRMGSSGTMPQDPDEKPSNRKFAQTAFRRLRQMQQDEKNR